MSIKTFIIISVKEIIIKKEFSNQRADKFIKKYLNDAPLSFIYKLFRKKDIKVNKHWIKENYILKEDDVLQIYVTDDQLNEFNNPKKIETIKDDINIVYEDENILIINKPDGLLVHGDEKEKRITLTNKVLSYLYKKGEYNPNEAGFTPGPVHRLDRNTSGLIIYAKNILASQELMKELQSHENITKEYLALVYGEVDESGEINAPLKKNEEEGIVRVTSIKNGGKPSITKYEKVISNEDYSLVKVKLVTGRTHQIRVHFAYINHPLVGDKKYGVFNKNVKDVELEKNMNQFLHSYKLSFINLSGNLSYLNGKSFVGKLDEKKIKILSKIYTNFDSSNI